MAKAFNTSKVGVMHPPIMEKATESASSPNSLAAMFCVQAKRYQDKVLYRYWREGQWRSLSWNEALRQSREIALG